MRVYLVDFDGLAYIGGVSTQITVRRPSLTAVFRVLFIPFLLFKRVKISVFQAFFRKA